MEEIIGDARIVLIGEGSHGTHEFYAARGKIIKWLIEEKGFCAIAAEADLPDAYRVNRYVHGMGRTTLRSKRCAGSSGSPCGYGATHSFGTSWTGSAINQQCSAAGRYQTGFYGLDLYSLHRSMQEVIDFLDGVDPKAAARARTRYACFDHASADDEQAYGFAAAFGARALV